MSLERFHAAQDNPSEGYVTALGEMRRGRKVSHWIWYIFPQITGLGSSSFTQEYAIRDWDEACAYVADPVLRGRYAEIAGVVAGHLRNGVPLVTLMDGPVDAQKLISSATLFRAAVAEWTKAGTCEESDRLLADCEAILDAAREQGHPACAHTMVRCRR